jgi:hypothetical protein
MLLEGMFQNRESKGQGNITKDKSNSREGGGVLCSCASIYNSFALAFKKYFLAILYSVCLHLLCLQTLEFSYM